MLNPEVAKMLSARKRKKLRHLLNVLNSNRTIKLIIDHHGDIIAVPVSWDPQEVDWVMPWKFQPNLLSPLGFISQVNKGAIVNEIEEALRISELPIGEHVLTPEEREIVKSIILKHLRMAGLVI